MSSDFNSLKDISFANVFEQYREQNLKQYIWHRNQAKTEIRPDKTSSLRTAHEEGPVITRTCSVYMLPHVCNLHIQKGEIEVGIEILITFKFFYSHINPTRQNASSILFYINVGNLSYAFIIKIILYLS